MSLDWQTIACSTRFLSDLDNFTYHGHTHIAKTDPCQLRGWHLYVAEECFDDLTSDTCRLTIQGGILERAAFGIQVADRADASSRRLLVGSNDMASSGRRCGAA